MSILDKLPEEYKEAVLKYKVKTLKLKAEEDENRMSLILDLLILLEKGNTLHYSPEMPFDKALLETGLVEVVDKEELIADSLYDPLPGTKKKLVKVLKLKDSVEKEK